MPRLRPLRRDEIPAAVAAYFQRNGKTYDDFPASALIQARNPAIFEAGRELGAAPGKSGQLSPLIRSLVCLRAAQMAQCAF